MEHADDHGEFLAVGLVVSCESMRTARAKVVDEPQPEIDLDDEDQKALDEAIAATHEGKLIPLETVRALLRTF